MLVPRRPGARPPTSLVPLDMNLLSPSQAPALRRRSAKPQSPRMEANRAACRGNDESIRLSPAQAAHTGQYVAAALSYAHSRGLVHRDIKPANLLFDEHGAVRVADFGLARALAEASWTEPTGALVGTARYAAPEQGTGATLDARADLYALGIVLVESVTGRVPDVADTLIGTLAVRARVPLVAPEELGALGPVVERAGRSQPSERYPDAVTMADALVDASRHLPPPGPLTLVGLVRAL